MAVPLFVLLYIFVLGLSLIFATYTVFFRDLIHFHGILMLMWMYMTPIFYPEKILLDKAPWLLKLNPLYLYIKYFRLIVLNGTLPSIQYHLVCVGVSVLSLVVGLLVFKKNQDRFALYF
jgi:ABC-2 type transport system permease protein